MSFCTHQKHAVCRICIVPIFCTLTYQGPHLVHHTNIICNFFVLISVFSTAVRNVVVRFFAQTKVVRSLKLCGLRHYIITNHHTNIIELMTIIYHLSTNDVYIIWVNLTVLLQDKIYYYT